MRKTKSFPFLFSLATASCAASTRETISRQEITTIQRLAPNIPQTDIRNIYNSTVKVQLERTISIEEPYFSKKVIYEHYAGTGVVLRNTNPEEYYVLTAGHVVPPKWNPFGKTIKEEHTADGLDAVVIKYTNIEEDNSDLALLKISGCLPYFTGKITPERKDSELLVSIGFPVTNEEKKTVFTGHLTRIRPLFSLALFEPSIGEGVSGAGAFSWNGQFHYDGTVIGMKGSQTIILPVSEFLKDTPLADEYLLAK